MSLGVNGGQRSVMTAPPFLTPHQCGPGSQALCACLSAPLQMSPVRAGHLLQQWFPYPLALSSTDVSSQLMGGILPHMLYYSSTYQVS